MYLRIPRKAYLLHKIREKAVNILLQKKFLSIYFFRLLVSSLGVTHIVYILLTRARYLVGRL